MCQFLYDDVIKIGICLSVKMTVINILPSNNSMRIKTNNIASKIFVREVSSIMHYLVVMGEVAVRDSNGSGAHDGVNEPILAIRHGHVINPNVGGTKDGDTITITLGPKPYMVLRVPDVPSSTRKDVMYVKVMDNNILNKLYGNASTVGNADVGSSAVNGLVSGHDELLVEPDDHAPSEDDPKRLLLDDCVAECAGLGVDEVSVRRVGDDVVAAVFATDGVAPEAEGTVSQLLPVLGPVAVTPPASVDWVRGLAWTCLFVPSTPQLSSRAV